MTRFFITRFFIRRLCLTALVVLGAALAAAPVRAQQSVEISADLFTIEEDRHEAVFTGQVVVKHAHLTLWAPKVVAVYGAGGTSDIRSFTASGPVRLQTGEHQATGARAVFTPGEQILTLSGEVTVTTDGGLLEAEELRVDLDTGIATFTAAPGQRVTGVFTAQ